MSKLNIESGVMMVKDILPNPSNPRVIKKEQLNKLKKSITDFPDMLSLRPLVIDENNIVVGGNMRLRALTELKILEAPYIKVFDLDDEKRKEFLIKDNLSYGDWDWDSIQEDWNITDIQDWGLEIPSWVNDDDVEPEFDKDEMDYTMNRYIQGKIKQIICYFSPEQYERVIKQLQYITQNENMESHTDCLIYLLDLYAEQKNLKE
jgi:hypothetical protein